MSVMDKSEALYTYKTYYGHFGKVTKRKKRKFKTTDFPFPDMKYHKQTSPYTCGPACLKMALSQLYKSNDFGEYELAKILNTNAEAGTCFEGFKNASEILNIECTSHECGTMEELTSKTANGEICIVGYSLIDCPHYSIFLKDNNCGIIFLNDPWNGEKFTIKKHKFMKRWKVRQCDFPNMPIPKEKESFRGYISIKLKNNDNNNNNSNETDKDDSKNDSDDGEMKQDQIASNEQSNEVNDRDGNDHNYNKESSEKGGSNDKATMDTTANNENSKEDKKPDT